MIQVTIGHASQSFWSPQIVAAIITGGVAIITGSLVALFAWRQWKTAKDKLAIDLFDKRLTNFRAWITPLRSRYDLLANARPEVPFYELSRMPIEFQEAAVEAEFLFGDDIADRIRGVASLMDDWSGSLAVRGDSAAQLGQQAGREIFRLERSARAYMMLDKIAVNQPAKTRKAAVS